MYTIYYEQCIQILLQEYAKNSKGTHRKTNLIINDIYIILIICWLILWVTNVFIISQSLAYLFKRLFYPSFIKQAYSILYLIIKVGIVMQLLRPCLLKRTVR